MLGDIPVEVVSGTIAFTDVPDPEVARVECGDVNNDGTVNILDLISSGAGSTST